MNQEYEERIKKIQLQIKELKEERKGFANRVNGYRNYCNTRIEFLKEHKKWCEQQLGTQK